MKKLATLLFGEKQDIRVVILMLMPSAAFVEFILLTYSIDWKTVLTAIMAFDILAGLLSNLQAKTHQAWKKESKISQRAFVIFHLTLYPLAVVLLQISIPLMILMLAMLLTKTIGFSIGTKLWK